LEIFKSFDLNPIPLNQKIENNFYFPQAAQSDFGPKSPWQPGLFLFFIFVSFPKSACQARLAHSAFRPSRGPLPPLLPPAEGQAAATFSACCRCRNHTALLHARKSTRSIRLIASPP
jgi:hypothetical protein